MSSPAFRDVTILHTQQDKGWCDYVLKHFRNDQLKMRLETLAVDMLDYENPPEVEVAVRESHVLVLFTTTHLFDYMEKKKEWFSPMLNKSDPDVSVTLFIMLAVRSEEMQEICSANDYKFDPSNTMMINDDGSNIRDVIAFILQQVEIYVAKKAKRETTTRRPSASETNSSSVQIVPSSISQPGEQVALIFKEAINGEVSVNFRHVKGDVKCELVNPYCALFKMPDVADDRISMQINVNGVRYSRHKIRNNTKVCQFSSVELLCEAYGTSSREELDAMLAERLFQSLCSDPIAMRIFNRPLGEPGTSQSSQTEYPTMLHWAALNGLSELCSALLSAPGAMAACDISNKDGLYPMDLARKNGHFELSDLIDEFIEAQEFADTCDLYVQYCSDLQEQGLVEEIESQYETMQHLKSDLSDTYMAPVSLSAAAPPLPPPRVATKGSILSKEDLLSPQEFLAVPTYPDFLVASGAVGSRSQTELIEIQEEVKKGNFSIKEAEMLFKSWKERYQTGAAVSFKQRQQNLKDFKKEYEKTMETLKNVNLKKKGKEKTATMPAVNISEPILKRQNLGSSKRQGSFGRGIKTNSNASCQSFDSGRDSTLSVLSHASSSSDDFEYHDPAERDELAPIRSGSLRSSAKANRKSYSEMFLTLREEDETAKDSSPPPPPIPARRTPSVSSVFSSSAAESTEAVSLSKPRVYSRKGSQNKK